MSMHGAEYERLAGAGVPDPIAVEASGPDVGGFDVTDLDLTHAMWRKSTYSGGNGSCVEVADLGEHVAVRDSKDRNGPKLVFEREVWRAFMAELKAGAYDL